MPVYEDTKRKTFFISTSYTAEDGTYKKKTIRGFTNRKDAEAYDSILKAKLQRNSSKVLLDLIHISDGNSTTNNLIGNKKLLMNEVLVEWCLESKKSNLSYTTIYNRKKVFESTIIPFFKNKDVRQIKSDDVRKWLDELSKTKDISTIKEYLSKLSQFYGFVSRTYEIDYNPVKAVKRPKVREKKRKEKIAWTWDDFKSFIVSVDDKEFFTMFWLWWNTGLRIGEMRGLKWIDFKYKKYLNIERQINNTTGKEDKLKSLNSYREYILDEYTIKVLSSWYDICCKDDGFCNSDYIFGNGKKPYSRDIISNILQKYIQIANKKRKTLLPHPFTPHCFRHSLVNILFAEGYTDIDIGKKIGDTPDTVRTTYAHFIPSTDNQIRNYYTLMNEKMADFCNFLS